VANKPLLVARDSKKMKKNDFFGKFLIFFEKEHRFFPFNEVFYISPLRHKGAKFSYNKCLHHFLPQITQITQFFRRCIYSAWRTRHVQFSKLVYALGQYHHTPNSFGLHFEPSE